MPGVDLSCVALDVGKHQFDVVHIPLVYNSKLGETALASGGLMLEKVILEGFAAHNFPASSTTETLGGSFTSF